VSSAGASHELEARVLELQSSVEAADLEVDKVGTYRDKVNELETELSILRVDVDSLCEASSDKACGE
jgi:hypothetical protein